MTINMKLEDLHTLAGQHKLPNDIVRSWMFRMNTQQNPVIDAQMVLDYRAYMKYWNTRILIVAIVLALVGFALMYIPKYHELGAIMAMIGGLIYALGTVLVIESKSMYHGIEQRQRNAELFIADYSVLCKLVGRLPSFELRIRSVEDLRCIADKDLIDQATLYLQLEETYGGIPAPFVKDQRLGAAIQELQSTYNALLNLGLASVNLEFYFDTARERLAA